MKSRRRAEHVRAPLCRRDDFQSRAGPSAAIVRRAVRQESDAGLRLKGRVLSGVVTWNTALTGSCSVLSRLPGR